MLQYRTVLANSSFELPTFIHNVSEYKVDEYLNVCTILRRCLCTGFKSFCLLLLLFSQIGSVQNHSRFPVIASSRKLADNAASFIHSLRHAADTSGREFGVFDQ